MQYETDIIGDNVDETKLIYCGGAGCCWLGYDCDTCNTKASSELKCCRLHCSSVSELVNPVTILTCQSRLCCCTNTMAVPPNEVGPMNCGFLGLSLFPKFACCPSVGAATQTFRIPEGVPDVTIDPRPIRYLGGFLCCHTGAWNLIPQCIGCSADYHLLCSHIKCLANVTEAGEGCHCCFAQCETCCCVFTGAFPQNDEAPYNCGCCGLMLYPEYHKCERFRKIVWMDKLELESRSGRRDHGLKGKRRGGHRVAMLRNEAEALTAAGKAGEAAEKTNEADRIAKKLAKYREKFHSAGAEVLIPKLVTDSLGNMYPEWLRTSKLEKDDGRRVTLHVNKDTMESMSIYGNNH